MRTVERTGLQTHDECYADLEKVAMAPQQVTWFWRDFQEFLLNEKSSMPQSRCNDDAKFYKNTYCNKNYCMYQEQINVSDFMSMKKNLDE